MEGTRFVRAVSSALKFGPALLALSLQWPGAATAAAQAQLPPQALHFEPTPEGFWARSSGLQLRLGVDRLEVLSKEATQGEPALLTVDWPGADPVARLEGERRREARSHYFLGRSPEAWRTEVPQFDQVRRRNVQPGVDLVFYGNGANLEYDLELLPHTNPDHLQIRYSGISAATVEPNGDLALTVQGSTVYSRAPRVFQIDDGQRKPVTARYQIAALTESSVTVGFQLDDYDRSAPLVIDPIVDFSTYLGTPRPDAIHAITTDSAGNLIAVGYTESLEFPIAGPAAQPNSGGSGEIFVSKFSPDGSQLIFSTYIGGGTFDKPSAVAVDSAGQIHLTGTTSSNNFPLVNPVQGYGGENEAFVVTLTSSGNAILRSTYLGGRKSDSGTSIAVDENQNVYVAGTTWSNNFPVKNAFQPQFAERNSSSDGFLTKYSGATGQVVFSTYLGGGTQDWLTGLVLAGSRPCVSGYTRSPTFPVLNALQGTLSGTDTSDAFVSCFKASGRELQFSSFLGGSAEDQVRGMAVDQSQALYLVGTTFSRDFPIQSALQPALASTPTTNFADGFVTKISADGSRIVYSTYFGGSNDDQVQGITVDASKRALIVGTTRSTDLPVNRPFQGYGGSFDGFVASLSANGQTLDWSSYLGGGGAETAHAVAKESAGPLWVAGATTGDFPTVNPYQATFRANGNFNPPYTDGFLTRIDPSIDAVPAQVDFAAGLFAVDEDVDRMYVRVQRQGNTYGRVCVAYKATDLTATAGQDYLSEPYYTCWNSGQSGIRKLDLRILADDISEGTEEVLLELKDLSGFAQPGPRAQAKIRIRNVD